MIETEVELHPLRKISLQNMSYSRINTFDWCQLKYYYAYIVQAPQTYGPPAVLGNIIHKALEITLEDGEEINKIELLQNYKALIPEYDPDAEIPQNMIQDGETMLIDFIQANPGPVNVHEKEMAFSFVLGNARFNGFIDSVSIKKDTVIIQDWKSGKAQITKKETPTNLQLAIYSSWLRHIMSDKKIYAELYYLRTGHTRGHKFTDEELDKLEELIQQRADEILNTENFLPTSIERHCKWCSYAEDGTCPTGVKRLKKFSK